MRRFPLVLVCLSSIACGGSVTGESAVTPDGAVTGGDGGATPDAVIVTESGVTLEAGNPGPALCAATGRPLAISVVFARGDIPSATGSVTAAVTSVSGDTIDLDACHPAADCVPMPIRVSLGNKDVALGPVVPVRAFVKLDWSRSPTGWFGDTWRVMVSSVETWGGMSNPAATGNAFLFAANSGQPESLPTAPFTIAKSALDCPATSGTSSCEYARAYAYEISGAGFPTTEVGMRQRAELGNLVFENFEAWDSKCTDDYWHWSWLATRKAL